MLLTLATSSLQSILVKPGDNQEQGSISLLEVPSFAINELDLRGLNIAASMLKGWSLSDLDKLRDEADKAACPCLVLEDESELTLLNSQDAVEAAKERITRIATAANRLGCNAIAVRCNATADEPGLQLAAQLFKDVMTTIERLELTMLIVPYAGLTADADRLTDLIKRVGGFRIGAMPTFGHAAESGAPAEELRKLAPYAGAIHATVTEFTRTGKHKGVDLNSCIEAIVSVSFVNTLAIEYVGQADPIKNIIKARESLVAAIEACAQT